MHLIAVVLQQAEIPDHCTGVNEDGLEVLLQGVGPSSRFVCVPSQAKLAVKATVAVTVTVAVVVAVAVTEVQLWV